MLCYPISQMDIHYSYSITMKDVPNNQDIQENKLITDVGTCCLLCLFKIIRWA